MKKAVFKWINNIMTIMCLAVIVIVFFSLLQSIKDPDRILTVLGYRPGIVISGSMAPVINTGDMTISKVVDPNSVRLGDVITYRVKGMVPIIHRVIAIHERDGRVMFETKGDANEVKDGEIISSDRLVGRLVLTIPKAGYAVEFLKSKTGFALIIIIPITALWISLLTSAYKKYHEKRKPV